MPTWTGNDLRAFEERQRQRKAEYSRPVAVVEPTPRDDMERTPPLQEANDGRVIVRVLSIRVRLLDEDNLCAKYLVDALRYLKYLPDDCPEKVKIEVSQRKCREGEPEHVEVEIL